MMLKIIELIVLFLALLGTYLSGTIILVNALDGKTEWQSYVPYGLTIIAWIALISLILIS